MNDLDALVMQDIMAASPGEGTAEIPVETAPPAPESKEEAAPPAVAPEASANAEAKPEEQANEPVVESKANERVIKHRGQEVKVPVEQEDELISKGFDYTQKTMELAQYRREAEKFVDEVKTQAKAQQEAVIALLSDPDKLEAIARAQRAKLGLAPAESTTMANAGQPTDPDEFVSKSTLSQMLKEVETRVRAEAKAEAEKAKTSAKAEIELSAMQSGYKTDFDTSIASLVNEKFPLLSDFGGPNIAEDIRKDGLQFVQAFMTLNPGVAINPDQVKSVMAESAKKRAEAIEGKLREREKKVALSRASLVEKGAEPRGGGAAPAPPAAKAPKLNDPALDLQVLKEIQSIMGQ